MYMYKIMIMIFIDVLLEKILKKYSELNQKIRKYRYILNNVQNKNGVYLINLMFILK